MSVYRREFQHSVPGDAHDGVVIAPPAPHSTLHHVAGHIEKSAHQYPKPAAEPPVDVSCSLATGSAHSASGNESLDVQLTKGGNFKTTYHNREINQSAVSHRPGTPFDQEISGMGHDLLNRCHIPHMKQAPGPQS